MKKVVKPGLGITNLLLIGLLFVGRATVSEARPPLLPVPEGVVELTNIGGADGSIVEAKDGALLLIQGGGVYESGKDTPSRRISKDGGKTWSDPVPLKAEMGAAGVIRLKSGALAMYGSKSTKRGVTYFATSQDDGETWTSPTQIPAYPDWYPMYHSMIQLKSGRILLVGYWGHLAANPPDVLRYAVGGSALWRGRWLWFEGHRSPGLGICLVYRSDDDGKIWEQCSGGLYGWFDERGEPNGEGGITDVYEPTAAETKDGRVLLFARSRVGRVLQSYSLDGGKIWFSVLPTELSSSQSPPMLVRIPSTGDLLCVWNQVSSEEIRRGFHRGRLSAAISKDSGLTWENFKTIERMEGMEDVARITPEFPIPRVVRGRPGLGQIPDGFAVFDYANVDIIGDRVFIRYSRTWPYEREDRSPAADPHQMQLDRKLYEQQGAGFTSEGTVMRIYPLDWFYKKN